MFPRVINVRGQDISWLKGQNNFHYSPLSGNHRPKQQPPGLHKRWLLISIPPVEPGRTPGVGLSLSQPDPAGQAAHEAFSWVAAFLVYQRSCFPSEISLSQLKTTRHARLLGSASPHPHADTGSGQSFPRSWVTFQRRVRWPECQRRCRWRLYSQTCW